MENNQHVDVNGIQISFEGSQVHKDSQQLNATPTVPANSSESESTSNKYTKGTLNFLKKTGSTMLAVADYLGGILASIFGLDQSKYQNELDEYYRMKKIEEEKQAQEGKALSELEGGQPQETTENAEVKHEEERL